MNLSSLSNPPSRKMKGLNGGRLPAKHLFKKIVKNETMAAGKRIDETGRVGMSAQGDCGQLRACDPAFGAVLQSGNGVCGKREAHSRFEEFGGFRSIKTQVGRPQFRQLPLRAQSGQGQIGILPCGNDHAHPRR